METGGNAVHFFGGFFGASVNQSLSVISNLGFRTWIFVGNRRKCCPFFWRHFWSIIESVIKKNSGFFEHGCCFKKWTCCPFFEDFLSISESVIQTSVFSENGISLKTGGNAVHFLEGTFWSISQSVIKKIRRNDGVFRPGIFVGNRRKCCPFFWRDFLEHESISDL